MPYTTPPVVAEVERLRRSLRICQGLVVLLVAAVAGMGLTGVTSEQQATAFRLVDPQGRTRATLAPGPDGNPLLTFFSADGKALRAIGPADDEPARLERVEAAVGALQQHLVLRERLSVGPVFPERPDAIDDLRRDQLQRDLERLEQQMRERRRELDRQLDEQNRRLDQLRREQERRDLQRHLFPDRP